MEKKEKVYIFGHRNPDTDSVTSAIALSCLKKELGYNSIPAILSSTNLETKFALNYFNVKEPIFLNDVKIKVKDLNYTKNYYIYENNSINTAYEKMSEAGISKIPVVDKEKHLLGILSMKDIAKEQFKDTLDKINTSYKNIIDTIEGEEILKYDDIIEGNLLVAGFKSTTFIESVELKKDNILIVGDRHSVIEYATKAGIKLLILVGNGEIKNEHLEIAKKNKINIIRTHHNTLITSRQIDLSNNVSTIDYEKNLLSVKEHENVSEFINVANKTRYSYFPVVDKNNKCSGILRLLDVNTGIKKKVILVDHNSYEQSAIGLDETEILEIIDHHNIANIGTKQPINFRNMPVGSTCTIVSILFKENNIKIPKEIAGIMLSGILSDTLILTSPTTTETDKKIVEELSYIAGVNYKEYGLAMLKAGSSIKGKTKEEVLYTDYKVYPVGDKKIGLGQLSTTNPNEILTNINDYVELLNRTSNNEGYYFIAFFITDVINSGSYIIYSDAGEEIFKKVYKNDSLKEGTFIKGVVSRKKQILPGIMLEME